MKFLGFRADKPPSLEEGSIRYQYPETVIKTRIAPRSHLERCIQMLKLIFYFELILLIGWIGCLYLSNYYAGPSTGVGLQQKDSNRIYNSDGVNGEDFNSDDVPSSDSLSIENQSSPKNDRFLTIDDDRLIVATEQSPSTTESSVDNSYQFTQSETTEPPTFDEENLPSAAILLLSMFEDLTRPVNFDDDVVSDGNDWEKNEDRADDNSVIIIQNIDREEQIGTTTEANMNDDDSLIAIEKSEIPIITQSQESADSLSKWLDMLSKKKTSDSVEYLDDIYGWENYDEKLDDDDTPAEEKIIDSSNYFDQTELDKTFEDRFKTLMATIDENIKDRFSDKEQLEIFPIYLEPYPERIDEFSDDNSDGTYKLPTMQRLLFDSEISHDLHRSTELDAGSSDDYGKLEWYRHPQHDKDNLISRLAREIGTKVDSDWNSSSDERTTSAPKVKRSVESSSEESSESDEKPQPSDSSSNNDKVTEIFKKILTKYPQLNDLNQNRTRLSVKDFENITNSLGEIMSEKSEYENSNGILASETSSLDNNIKAKAT